MTVLVRRENAPSRYIGARGWTASRKRAWKFASPQAAVRFCWEHDLRSAEVLVDFNEPNAVMVAIKISGETAPSGTVEWFDSDHNFVFA